MGNRSTTKMTEGGGVKSSFVLYPEAEDALEELLQVWPFKSSSEAITVALRYLAAQTRSGLPRIDLDDGQRS
jgi:hypothetical protein